MPWWLWYELRAVFGHHRPRTPVTRQATVNCVWQDHTVYEADIGGFAGNAGLTVVPPAAGLLLPTSSDAP